MSVVDGSRGAFERVAVGCPAKVNLELHVLGRRPDGYHEIDTRFQTIDLWDRLDVERADGLSITCDDDRVPTGPANTVLAVAEALRGTASADRKLGARFRLAKRIPVAGGLGGGSSNAAGALLALDALWGLRRSRDELRTVGARVGADVPFFLSGGTARGTGRGDEIRPEPFRALEFLLLGVPPFGLSTPRVYAALDARPLTQVQPNASVAPLSGGIRAEVARVDREANDLQQAAFRIRPELGVFRNELLESGADRALLSGSGSTVYGEFGSSRARDRALSALRDRFRDWGLVATRAIKSGVVRIDDP